MNTNSQLHRPPRSRKRKIGIAAACFLGFILIVVLALAIAVQCSRKPWRSPDTTGWQTGDIFFSAGNSWKSLAVRLFGDKSEEGSTHCGIVMMRDGVPMLVHMSTETGEIRAEYIEDYARVNDVSAVTVRRLRQLPDTVVLRRYVDYLFRRKKRFDNNFNARDTTEYYCTEFVIHAMDHAGNSSFMPLLTDDYIYPEQLETSPAVSRLP